MSRQAREISESGIYHIILRGANRQEIFHEDEDKIRFLETLDRYKKENLMSIGTTFNDIPSALLATVTKCIISRIFFFVPIA